MATGLEESLSGVADGAPKTMDVGLFGLEVPDSWPEVSSTAHESSSLTLAVMLMWLSTLVGHFKVR